MRVLFSGGASGGHVNPALAIAEIVKANYPNSEIAFVGTPNGIENSLVPQAGYKLYKIKIGGVNGKTGINKLMAYARAFTSQFSAKKIVKEFKPDIVIGTGGYACFPALMAGTLMRSVAGLLCRSSSSMDSQSCNGNIASIESDSRCCDKIFLQFSTDVELLSIIVLAGISSANHWRNTLMS